MANPISKVSLETVTQMLSEYKTSKAAFQWLKDNDQLILKNGETVDDLARSCVAPIKLHRAALDQILDNCSEF